MCVGLFTIFQQCLVKDINASENENFPCGELERESEKM